ncbi:alpha/beta fold hydrolase [Agrobacterium sp. 22-226-1]
MGQIVHPERARKILPDPADSDADTRQCRLLQRDVTQHPAHRALQQAKQDLALVGRRPDRIVADVDGRMGDCILRLYRSALNVGREWQPSLANITASTLVVHGLKDRPVPPELAEALAKDIRAREVVLLDAGHWYPLQRPDEMAMALNTFWSS